MTFIVRIVDKYLNLHNTLLGAALGELWGTFILIIFGLGVIIQVDISQNTHGSFLSISLGWGFAVMLAVFWSGKLGNGHCNPAVTLAFAAIGRLEWKRVPCYWLAQIIGAFLAALVLFLIYYEKILNMAMTKDDGKFVIQSTGSFFITLRTTGLLTAFFDQFFGTFLLTSCAIAITDKDGFDLPDYLHPIMLGFMVSGIVGCFAINAGAALNPARDLGPRIMLAMCGWGRNAFSAVEYYFWVPIIAPLMGGVTGALFYEVCIGVHLHAKSTKKSLQIKKASFPSSKEGLEVSSNAHNVESIRFNEAGHLCCRLLNVMKENPKIETMYRLQRQQTIIIYKIDFIHRNEWAQLIKTSTPSIENEPCK